KGLLPFLGAAGYDEALVQQALARLRSYYQQQGHWHVRVESSQGREGGRLALSIVIDPGPVYTLEAIEVTGNRAVAAAKLAPLLTTAPRSVLHPGSGRLVQATLDEDLDNVRSFYALQGFAEVKVGPPQVSEQGARLRLRVPIEEGAQQRL